MSWMMSLLCFSLSSMAEVPTKKYAPNFILTPINLQRVVSRFQSPDIRLSQFVGWQSSRPVSNVIVIMGAEQTAEQDIRALKAAYQKAIEQDIEILVLYSSGKKDFATAIQRLDPMFPVLNDPFQVVRGRYQYLSSQYCYVINLKGILASENCSNINDVIQILSK